MLLLQDHRPVSPIGQVHPIAYENLFNSNQHLSRKGGGPDV